ncbi:hypothetical protein PVAP13_3KG573700 [Panicum virgatum]|uniref:No apical meristem-associated C-terminal domain-containing protein n=1 Tax=Panicum virgatum TaxID=38727 RepID=A0A8T0V352_PANVG|nr:hypothetical protein PVAP13_3KG573700 [Panicum virgatum]
MERSTQASRAIFGGRRPPCLTTAPPEKTRHRPFVAPHPRRTANPPAAGLPRRQDLPSPAGGLPCQLPNDVLVPPRGRQTSTFTEPQGASPPFSTAAIFDARSTASSLVLMYEAADDDFRSTPIVDWTPDFSANHFSICLITSELILFLMFTSESSLVVLSSSLLWSPLELLMASDPTPSSGGKGVSRRGSGYIQCEDIQLCTSWMNISNDPIIDFDSNRSANSLEHRMGIILKDCMLFQACYEQIERRNPSGVPYQEHMIEAQARYARASNGKSFQLVHCWLKVRHCEKFASLLLNKMPSRKQDAAPEGEEQQEASQGPPSKKARPPEGDDEYKDMMQNLMVMKAEEHKMKKERWDKDMVMEERRLQWEHEQKIILCLLL